MTRGGSRVGAVASAFPPKGTGSDWHSYYNCILWLDASDATTLFSNTGGTVAATARAAVNRGKDKSRTGNHATADQSAATLTLDASLGRTFLRGRLGMSLTNPYLLASCAAVTLFMVLKADNTTGSDCLSPFVATTASMPYIATVSGSVYETLGMVTSSSQWAVVGSMTTAANWNSTPSPWSTAYRRMLYIIVCNPATNTMSILRSDGVTVVYQTQFDRSYWTNTNPTTLGYCHWIGSGLWYYFTGDLAEMLVFNTALTIGTSPSVTDVATMLRNKWGLL